MRGYRSAADCFHCDLIFGFCSCLQPRLHFPVNIDPRLPIAVRCLHTHFVGNVTEKVLYEMIPPGWQNKIPFILYLTEKIGSCNINSVRISRGLLRIKATSPIEFDSYIFESVAQYLAKESRLACIVCGEKAFRRKAEPEQPALCKEHYIQFVNFEPEPNPAVLHDGV